MKLSHIKIENFGPFYRSHEVDLSVQSESPVIIIHGENMRGKTSFANAIKWCLYGCVFDRRDREIETYRLMSYDAIEEGDFHMSVIINFEHDDHQYQLERHVQANHSPDSDEDLQESQYLRRDGHILPSEDVTKTIRNMLHEDISRFFLFDGEMLNRYEILVSDPDREVNLIKDSIEQILGLPALTLVGEDINYLKSEAEKRQLKAVRAKKKSERLVAEAQQISNELDALDKDIENMNIQLANVEREQDGYNERLKKFEEIRTESREIEQLETSIEEGEDRLKEIQNECKEITSSAWWVPICNSANDLLLSLTEQAETQEKERNTLEKLKFEKDLFQQGIEKSQCPICDTKLSTDKTKSFIKKISKSEKLIKGLESKSIGDPSIFTKVSRLQLFADGGPAASLREKEIQYRRSGIELSRQKRRWRTIRESLKGHDIRDIRITEEKRDECVIQASAIKQNIETSETRRKEKAAEYTRKNQEIQKLPEADKRTAAECEMYTSLETIFVKAVDIFRDNARLDVEKEATNIFKQIINEEEFDRLEINNQYGLSITDSSGRDIRDRSAGAEQVIALSLIGALNRCAVREGPIIMDTPFGRLDVTHRKNILEFIPTMGPQIILLVQSGEFDRDRDVAYLSKKIGREYRLIRDDSPTKSRFEPIP